MTDEDFLGGAVAKLSQETRAAATAISVVQSTLGMRLDHRKVEEIADLYTAPRGAVLALLGWAVDPRNPGGRIDLLLNQEPINVPEPEQSKTLISLAVCRTLR